MRAFVIITDTIWEVDGRIVDDDDFVISSGPPNSGLTGIIMRKGKWSLTKDLAFMILEREVEFNRKSWEEHAEKHEKAQNAYDANYARSQADTFKSILPRARLMDPTLIRKK